MYMYLYMSLYNKHSTRKWNKYFSLNDKFEFLLKCAQKVFVGAGNVEQPLPLLAKQVFINTGNT